jgi:exopolysaccharide production protein ExoQ
MNVKITNQERPGTGERILTVIILSYSTGAFVPLLKGDFDPRSYTGEGTLLTNVFWALVYTATILALWTHKERAIERLKGNPFLIVLTLLPFLSAFWSDIPFYTLLRSCALLATTLIGLYFAVRYSLEEQLEVLAVTLAIGAVLSYLTVFFLPAYGIGTGDFQGDWQGVYEHKNGLGSFMGLGAITCWLRFRSGGRAAGIFGVAAILCGILVVQSHSATAIVVLGTMSIVLFAFRWRGLFLKRVRVWVFIWATALGSAAWFFTSRYEQLLDYLGKDENLTGRAVIWSFVWSNIVQRPLLGFGYYSFWRGEDGPSADYWRATGSPIFHSHNAFLDNLVEMGAVGLILLIIVLGITLGKAWRLMWSGQAPIDTWPFLFLVFLLCSSFTETGMLRTNHILWILFTSVSFAIDARLRGPTSAQVRKATGPHVIPETYPLFSNQHPVQGSQP